MGAVKAWYQSLYGPMVDVLEAEFGVRFELWDTGGGCQALVGKFEGDVTVYLTDAPHSINGREAEISDMLFRTSVGERTVGYAVGVYRDASCTHLAYNEFPAANVVDLPALVKDMLWVAQLAARNIPVQEMNTPHERKES